MHRNTRRFGAAVMAAGSLLILSACSAPQTAPMVQKPAPTAPAPATIVDSSLVSGASTLEEGNTFTGDPSAGQTGTYVSGELNLTIHCSPKTWDAERGEISTEVTVTNNGSALEHVILVLDGMSPSTVSLANADATLDGKGYIYFGPLEAGATSQARILRFSSESMVDYRCVTHIEARPANGDVCVLPENLETFFCDLSLDEQLKDAFHGDFMQLLDCNLSLEDRLGLAQLCLQRLSEVTDPAVCFQLRQELASCLFTGLRPRLDDWLCYVTDEELDARIRLFVWECLQLDACELVSLQDYLMARFEAECIPEGCDAVLADRLRGGFGELLDFCSEQYVTLL